MRDWSPSACGGSSAAGIGRAPRSKVGDRPASSFFVLNHGYLGRLAHLLGRRDLDRIHTQTTIRVNRAIDRIGKHKPPNRSLVGKKDLFQGGHLARVELPQSDPPPRAQSRRIAISEIRLSE